MGMDGFQHGSGRGSQSTCSNVGGEAKSCVADGCSEVTSFWAGAGSCTAAESSKVKLLIQLQALNQMFLTHYIREEFCSGKIIIAEDYEAILVSIDSIFGVLFPAWWCHGSCQDSKLISSATTHLDCLYHRSPEQFQISSGNLKIEVHSYATWMNTLNIIIHSKYWQQQSNQQNSFITSKPKIANICRQSHTTTKRDLFPGVVS